MLVNVFRFFFRRLFYATSELLFLSHYGTSWFAFGTWAKTYLIQPQLNQWSLVLPNPFITVARMPKPGILIYAITGHSRSLLGHYVFFGGCPPQKPLFFYSLAVAVRGDLQKPASQR